MSGPRPGASLSYLISGLSTDCLWLAQQRAQSFCRNTVLRIRLKCTRLRACSEREKVCEKAGPCFLYARQGPRSLIVSKGMNPNFHTSKGCISSSWMSSKYMVPKQVRLGLVKKSIEHFLC